MQESAPNVDVRMASRCEHHGGYAVDDNADAGYPDDDVGRYGLRVLQPLNGFPHDCADGNQEQHRIHQGREDGCAFEAIGESGAWQPFGQATGEEGQQQTEHIGKVVAGIG